MDAPSLEGFKARLSQALSMGVQEGVSAHSTGVGTRWFLRRLPTQTVLWGFFCSCGVTTKDWVDNLM